MTELCNVTSHVWRDYPADEPLFQCRVCEALGRKKGRKITLLQCVECGGVATSRTIIGDKIVPICAVCADKPCEVHQSWSQFRGRESWFSCDRCGMVGQLDASGVFVPAKCITCGEPAMMLNDEEADVPSCYDHFVGVILL